MEDSIRERSKQLFGNSYMLEVCISLGEVADRTTLSQLAQEHGISSVSLYSKPIKRLLALGLLLPSGREGDDYRERWYAPAPSSLWSAAREITAESR